MWYFYFIFSISSFACPPQFAQSICVIFIPASFSHWLVQPKSQMRVRRKCQPAVFFVLLLIHYIRADFYHPLKAHNFHHFKFKPATIFQHLKFYKKIKALNFPHISNFKSRQKFEFLEKWNKIPKLRVLCSCCCCSHGQEKRMITSRAKVKYAN